MKKILLIGTGGTIASKWTEDGIAPQTTASEMLEFIPQIRTKCRVDALQLFNLDSTNIHHIHWGEMAKCIRDRYEDYDGFVITHGSDTMAYTAAALAYLIQDSPKPVVITGSQKSICTKETDARTNLNDAFLFALSDFACGVHLVFDGKVILGTRARKTRSKSYDSFSSIDFPEAARILDGQIISFIQQELDGMKPTFYDRMESKVFVLKLFPGIKPEVVSLLKPHYHALIIESFGVGGIPCYDDFDFLDVIEDWVLSGRVLVMSTQVPHEGINLELYKVGYALKRKLDVLEAHNMTLESVVTKLMWVLGQTHDRDETKALFYRPVQNDILLPMA
jgi:L-asparaginase